MSDKYFDFPAKKMLIKTIVEFSKSSMKSDDIFSANFAASPYGVGTDITVLAHGNFAATAWNTQAWMICWLPSGQVVPQRSFKRWGRSHALPIAKRRKNDGWREATKSNGFFKLVRPIQAVAECGTL